ncbi:MAG TPA: gephyrin-like molybdotransferase Glp [Candidatus Thermoplasmatota archaeon]|nr:gephyrin-like molybdotransferase Glp [Candidatus Thermoplasmatota archaeon]
MPPAKRASRTAPPRMRPFKALLSREKALEILLGAVRPIDAKEKVPLAESAGRVLAADARAPADVPAFTRSAMDGYAVRAEDTFGATRAAPKSLKVRESVHAGDVARGSVKAGVAIQIATGGKLPPGANAVVKVESTTAKAGQVLVHEAVPPGANVSLQGSDVKRGVAALRAGDVLAPARVGLLAALGIAQVEVYRRPSVSIVPTGNEVVEPGRALREGQVYNSNAYAVEALLAEHGALCRRHPVAGDDVDTLAKALLKDAKDADLVVLTGGSSVGERDLAVDVVQSAGEVLVHGVQVKPGKPLLVGRLSDGRVVMGLPGYPTSCYTNAAIFGIPAVRRLARLPTWTPRSARVPLGERVASNLGRYQILPVAIREGKAYSTFKESGAITSVAASEGWIGIPDNRDLVDAGEEVEVFFWR